MKKRVRKAAAVLLSLVMALSLCPWVPAAEYPADTQTILADSYAGKTVILHSNDVHGEIRDETLAETWYGRLFIRAYYAVSPTAVKLFGDNAWFQTFFRSRLDQMISHLQSDGVASTPYQDQAW